MNWLKGMFSGVIKAGAYAIARHVATWSGGLILAWLLSHHVGSDFAQRLIGDLQDALLTLTGIGLTAAGIGTSLKDVGGVGGKMAVTGSAAFDAGVAHAEALEQPGADTQAANDNAKVAAVAHAMKTADTATPATKAAIVTALKNGTF